MLPGMTAPTSEVELCMLCSSQAANDKRGRSASAYISRPIPLTSLRRASDNPSGSSTLASIEVIRREIAR